MGLRDGFPQFPSPSGVQGQSPGRRSWEQRPPEAEAYLLMNALILILCKNKISELFKKNHYHKFGLAQGEVWLSGSVVGHINEVTLRRAGLMLRWVTVRGYTVLVFNQATQANSVWSSLRG